MKDASLLLEDLFTDLSSKCSTVKQKRDMSTIRARLAHEGSSFLTITLPKFADDVFNAIEQAQVNADHFVGWRRWLCLPSFMRGFTSLVFCAQTGRLLDEPNVESIRAIRQIGYFYKKVHLACSRRRTQKALDDYIATDCDLGPTFNSISSEDSELFEKVSRVFISSIFPEEVISDELLPHHGPGSTEEKVQGNGKYRPESYPWYEKLEPHFSPGCTMYSSDECWFNDSTLIKNVARGNEAPVRVITVPKTLKTPRVIALEPVIIQMTQQSVKDYMVKRIESSPLTSGHINFSDQGINQRLALSASLSRVHATLDLSSASDRVHNELVKKMFSVNPSLLELVQCTRSERACVGSQTLTLNKFASMGSALCFPVEALFFTVCLLISEIKYRALPLSYKNMKMLMRDIYVYGDDIIIPTDQVERAIATLKTYGNVVSLSKSFWNSAFRESCGMDAYAGVDITPIYMRKIMPRSRRNASAITSNVATANLLFRRGLKRTTLNLKNKIEAAIGFKLPIVSDTCAGLGWWFDDGLSSNRLHWNHKFQRQEVLTLVPQVQSEEDELTGYNALCKALINLNRPDDSTPFVWKKSDPFKWELIIRSQEKKSLTHSQRRGVVTLKRRKVVPY